MPKRQVWLFNLFSNRSQLSAGLLHLPLLPARPQLCQANCQVCTEPVLLCCGFLLLPLPLRLQSILRAANNAQMRGPALLLNHRKMQL